MKKLTWWFNHIFETDLTKTQVFLLVTFWVLIGATLLVALFNLPTPFGD